jgi:transposase
MSLRRFYKKITPGYEVIDEKEWMQDKVIDIYFKRDSSAPLICFKCSQYLDKAKVAEHRVKVRAMDIMGFKTYFHLKRPKHFCKNCNKIRTAKIEWISEETPHVTEEYAWWLGRLCEIAPVSKAAELVGIDRTTMWRMDFKRMRRMFQNYKIPMPTRISVDEVYARKKKEYKKESRDKRFFTVICDLDTRRVIWVSESRSKEALDEFFNIIGDDGCKDIKIVAADQFDGYKKSVEENCPEAIFVWDRFHIMQNFNRYLNDDRAWLHNYNCKGETKRLTRGKFKQLFLKKSERRTGKENQHINDVMDENQDFYALELIKEGMYQLFDSESASVARERFDKIGKWIKESKVFKNLEKWWKNLDQGWGTFGNYFKNRVSSSLSEGQNNVIKTLKKRAYGYRNMAYFKLKILQVCGYLNSKYISMGIQ